MLLAYLNLYSCEKVHTYIATKFIPTKYKEGIYNNNSGRVNNKLSHGISPVNLVHKEKTHAVLCL